MSYITGRSGNHVLIVSHRWDLDQFLCAISAIVPRGTIRLINRFPPRLFHVEHLHHEVALRFHKPVF
jgi:hypothetical protein